MHVDHTDRFVNGQTPLPVKTTSPACHGPAAAPGVEMPHRHLLTVATKRAFLIIIPCSSITEGRQPRRSAIGNTLSGVPTPVGHAPATRSAAPRQWRAGADRGLPRAVRQWDSPVAEAHLRGRACRHSGSTQRAVESRGAWCWACTITCIDVRFNGEALQVKQVALRVGEDLAVTSGALVYRDAVCEVNQAVVEY